MQQVQSEQKAVAYAPARVTSRNYGHEMDFELVVPGFDAGGKCSLMRTAAECLLSSAPHSHGRLHTLHHSDLRASRSACQRDVDVSTTTPRPKPSSKPKRQHTTVGPFFPVEIVERSKKYVPRIGPRSQIPGHL